MLFCAKNEGQCFVECNLAIRIGVDLYFQSSSSIKYVSASLLLHHTTQIRYLSSRIPLPRITNSFSGKFKDSDHLGSRRLFKYLQEYLMDRATIINSCQPISDRGTIDRLYAYSCWICVLIQKQFYDMIP